MLLQGWLQHTAAADLLKRSGHDLAVLKRQARSAAFRPIPLNATFSADAPVALTRLNSRNVIG